MKAYVGADVYLQVQSTFVLHGGERSASRPGPFIPGKEQPVPIGQEAGWV